MLLLVVVSNRKVDNRYVASPCTFLQLHVKLPLSQCKFFFKVMSLLCKCSFKTSLLSNPFQTLWTLTLPIWHSGTDILSPGHYSPAVNKYLKSDLWEIEGSKKEKPKKNLEHWIQCWNRRCSGPLCSFFFFFFPEFFFFFFLNLSYNTS